MIGISIVLTIVTLCSCVTRTLGSEEDDPFCVFVDCSNAKAQKYCPVKCGDPEYCEAVDCSLHNSETWCPFKCAPDVEDPEICEAVDCSMSCSETLCPLKCAFGIQNASQSQTTPPTPLPSHSQSPVCNSYKNISDAWRHIDYANRGRFPMNCDVNSRDTPTWEPEYTNLDFGTSWFRFTGAAGTHLPTAPAPGSGPYSGNQYCGAISAGYIVSGGHPTVQDGIVSRDICFEFSDSSCHVKTTVKVAACWEMALPNHYETYYVYQLQPTPKCNLAYCAIDRSSYGTQVLTTT